MALFTTRLLRASGRAAGMVLAFASLIAIGTSTISALIWSIDAKSIPMYALVWISIWLLVGLVIAALIFALRSFIGKFLLSLAAAAAGGSLVGIGALLGVSYRNSCSAIGWQYDERADLLVPALVWTDQWGCSRVGKYQRFAGVWKYGEWSYLFKPTGPQSSLPLGKLKLDDAGKNMMFDVLLHKRLSPYEEPKVYIEFDGNMLTQGRHGSASYPVYHVRDIVAARVLSR